MGGSIDRIVMDGVILACLIRSGLLVAEVARSPRVAESFVEGPLSARPRLVGSRSVTWADACLPWCAFLVVCSLLLLNQVLFNVYVLVGKGGDVSEIAAYFPPGWFVLALDSPLISVLGSVVSPEEASFWLAPTLLRVQAVLELPFALFAYLTVAWMVDPAVFRFLVKNGQAWWAAGSYTLVLCTLELELRNPWTESDLVCRVLGFVATCGVTSAMSRRVPGAEAYPAAHQRPAKIWQWCVLAVGIACVVGLTLLFAYITLLYNLGLWGRFHWLVWPALVVSSAVIIGRNRWIVPEMQAASPPNAPMSARDGIPSSLRMFAALSSHFSVFFFAAALPIRYQLGEPLASGAGLLLILAAVLLGAVEGFRSLPHHRMARQRWKWGITAGCVVGGIFCVSDLFGLLVGPWMHWNDLYLAQKVLLFVVPFFFTWRGVELWYAKRLAGY